METPPQERALFTAPITTLGQHCEQQVRREWLNRHEELFDAHPHPVLVEDIQSCLMGTMGMLDHNTPRLGALCLSYAIRVPSPKAAHVMMIDNHAALEVSDHGFAHFEKMNDDERLRRPVFFTMRIRKQTIAERLMMAAQPELQYDETLWGMVDYVEDWVDDRGDLLSPLVMCPMSLMTYLHESGYRVRSSFTRHGRRATQAGFGKHGMFFATLIGQGLVIETGFNYRILSRELRLFLDRARRKHQPILRERA